MTSLSSPQGFMPCGSGVVVGGPYARRNAPQGADPCDYD